MTSRKYMLRTIVQADRTSDGEGSLYGLRKHNGKIVSFAYYHRCDVPGDFDGLPAIAPVIQRLIDLAGGVLPKSKYPYTVVSRDDITGSQRWRATTTTYGWHIMPASSYDPAIFPNGHNAGKCRVASTRFELTSHGYKYMVCSGYPDYTRMKEVSK